METRTQDIQDRMRRWLDTLATKLDSLARSLAALNSRFTTPDSKADWTQDAAFKDLWKAINTLRQAVCDVKDTGKQWCQ